MHNVCVHVLNLMLLRDGNYVADAERVSNVTSAMKNMEQNRLRRTPTPEDNEYPCKVFYLVVEPICVKNSHVFLPDSDSQFATSVQRVYDPKWCQIRRDF